MPEYKTNIGPFQNVAASSDYRVNIGPYQGGFAATITEQSTGVTKNLYDPVEFYVVAIGTPTPTYQWYKDDVLIPGETDSTLTFEVDTDSGGSYTCIATNDAGSDESDPMVLSIVPEILTQSQSQSVQAGQHLMLAVVAVGHPSPTYQWYKDDVLIPGETSSVLDFYVSDIGIHAYTCTVENAVGSVESDPIVITSVPNSNMYNIFNLPIDLAREG
jgi:hypothetical protein